MVRILITLLGFLNGGYMLLDGIYVLCKGKYIGPEKPGPWSYLFESAGVNVFNLGPLFIVYGLAWFIFLAGLWKRAPWTYRFGLILCLLTLWYLPLGTLFSLIIFIVLIIRRKTVQAR